MYYPYYCDYGNLAIFSKFKISSVKHITLGRDNHYFIERYLLWISLEINGKKIHVFNTHLDVFDTTEITRFKQIKLVLSEIKKINLLDLILLMGDFNSIYKNDYTEQYFNEILMKDPKHIPPDENILVIKEIVKYMHDVKRIDENALVRNIKNQFTVWSLRRVDYIFINQKVKLNYFINYNHSSDHYLIYCDLYL